MGGEHFMGGAAQSTARRDRLRMVCSARPMGLTGKRLVDESNLRAVGEGPMEKFGPIFLFEEGLIPEEDN